MAARICIAVASLLLVVSPLGFGQAVFDDVDSITINACCNQTEETDEIKRELQEIKELLRTVLANSACCCNQPGTPSTTTQRPTDPYPNPRDCYEVQQNGYSTSGVYTIQPDESTPIDVYCDMDTDGGGWTVFQRRVDGTEDFFRDWAYYEDGFGSLEGEHWLGLKSLYYLTNQQANHLRIDLADFEDNTRYAKYGTFSIDSSTNNFRLTVGSYSGDAGDAMAEQHNQYFSTPDRDNDEYYDGKCTDLFKGAWWYKTCHHSNLNGLYLGGPHESYADGIEWYEWRGYYYSLKFTEMKLRPALA